MAKTHVKVTAIINADVDTVWAHIRDFNGMPSWHPAIADSKIEDGHDSDKIGCIRNFNLVNDGGNIREQLLALSDLDRSFGYSILESPMKLSQYVAGLSLLPVSNSQHCVATWVAEFNCAAEDEEGLVDLIGNSVFQGGFDALNEHFS